MKRELIPWRRSRSALPSLRTEEHPFEDLHRRMNQLFEEFLGNPGELMPSMPFLSGGRFPAGIPKVDVAETDDEVVVTADLPGLEQKDVEVVLEDELLTLKGQRQEESEQKKRNYRMVERSMGSFQRTIALPPGVDTEKAKATFKKGVLTIHLAKLPEAKARQRRIAIQGD